MNKHYLYLITILFISLLSNNVLVNPVSAAAGQNDIFSHAETLLPPLQNWSGKSEALIAASDDPWIIPVEASGLTTTPSYEETIAWLLQLVAAAPELKMVSMGTSLQGRDTWMVIASANEAFTATAMQADGKPLLLVHAGIHSGEIDGKDAGLMLLRDMTVEGKHKQLLAHANLLFSPILNVDGHERSSPFNRINQRGPGQMGWRTNARSQNLNRDFTKLAGDAAFAASPAQRLMWFYQQTPFYNQQYLLYPVARVPVSKPTGDF